MDAVSLVAYVVPPVLRAGEPSELLLGVYAATHQELSLEIRERQGQPLLEARVSLGCGPQTLRVLVPQAPLEAGGWRLSLSDTAGAG